MRIARLDLPAFGAFLDRSLELPEGPAVVVGANEAGKTTIFAAVTTLFYGFDPANERDFPYVPRAGGRRAELAAEIALDDGSRATAGRRLLASPAGEWQHGGEKENLANRPLPPAAHVGRELYEALYALSLDDMAALDGRAFAQVEERLLGELGNPWHRPARAVADELDAEAKRLWRPDRRGKTRHQELRGELDRLKGELKQAGERQETLKEQEAERARVGYRLEELARYRAELRDRIRRSERVGQLRADLVRLDRLAEGIGDIEAARRLGDDPVRDWRELVRRGEELTAQVDELAQEVARQRDRRGRVTEADRALVADDEAAGVGALAAKAEEAEGAWERAASDEERAHAELVERAEAVLAGPWADAYGENLEGLAPAELRDRAAAAETARSEAADTERRLEASGGGAGPPTFSGVYLVLPLAVGAVLGLAGVWWWPLWGLAGLALLVGIAAGTYNLYAGHLERRRRQAQEPRERELAQARKRAEAARSEVAGLLEGLPLPAGSLEAPGTDLAGRIESLRSAWTHYRRAREEREAQHRKADERRRAVTAVLARHGLKAEGGDLAAAAEALDRRLREARERVHEAEAAAGELQRLEARCTEMAQWLGALASAEADLAARIAAVAGTEGSWKERLRTAGQAAADLRQWDSEWRGLRERYPEVAYPRAAVAEAGDDLLEGPELERAREELEQLDNEHSELTERRARVDEALERGREIQDVGLIQGQIDDINSALAETQREHDRLRLLESLVREADRRFREAHQPDVLRRASAYLDRVTGGRYPQLELDEEVLRVRDQDGILREVAEPSGGLSRGTRDQVFLALRLAVADHLDAGNERLPLLLDEVFVNWDPKRQEAGLAGLAEMAGERQVLLFTCHPEQGERAGRILGTEPVALAAPGGAEEA